MSKFATSKTGNKDLLAATESLQADIGRTGSSLVTKEAFEATLSLESANGAALSTAVATHTDLKNRMIQLLANHGYDCTNPDPKLRHFTDTQIESGAIILAATHNPRAYHAAATANKRLSMEGAVTIDSTLTAGLDFSDKLHPSLESFDDRALSDNLGFSAIFNVAAARQDELGEAFYPTVVVTPDQSGVALSIRKIQVYHEVRHDQSGRPTDFGRQNLLDAVYEPSILSEPMTAAIPVFVTGNAENNDKFCPDVPPYAAPAVNGVAFNTAPLKPAIDINLLSLSQNPGVTPTGQFDSFDSLDHRLSLKALYLKVDNGTDVSIIRLDTMNLPRTNYLKSNEGLDREVQLNFSNDDFTLEGITKDITGVNAAALTYLTTGGRNNWFVRLKIAGSGRGFLNFGTVSFNPQQVVIDSVWNNLGANNHAQITNPADIAALKTALGSLSIVGYELEAARANLNRRTMGLLIDTVEYNEIHTVPLGSPITANTPVTQTKTSTDITAPITCARIRNSNNAVIKLQQYASQLSALKLSYDRRTPVPNIQGIARHVLRPYYKKDIFDAVNTVNSIKSQDRSIDLSAALINRIRDLVYYMIRDSGYQIALDSETNHTGEKPIVLIGTDPVIQKYLIVPGDDRLASIGYESRVVTSMNKNMFGKIYVTVTRASQKGADPLSFGFMAWMPELAATTQVTRNGSTTIENTVQPRAIHVNTLPLLIEMEVTNLQQAIGDRVPVPFKTVP